MLWESASISLIEHGELQATGKFNHGIVQLCNYTVELGLLAAQRMFMNRVDRDSEHV